MQRSDLRGVFQTLGHLGLFAVTGAVTAYGFVRGLWVPFAVALWCHGTVGTFFRGLAVHELGHGTVFQDPLAQPLLPAASQPAVVVEPPRVRDEPHLPPPLHAAPRP